MLHLDTPVHDSLTIMADAGKHKAVLIRYRYITQRTGFFKGTSADQDRRFSDKELKLLKTMKFPPEFEKKVRSQLASSVDVAHLT